MLLNLSWLSGNFDDRGSMIYGYNTFQSLRGCISPLWHDLHMWISLQINFWWELHLPGLRSSYLKTNPDATLKDLFEKRQSAMSSYIVFSICMSWFRFKCKYCMTILVTLLGFILPVKKHSVMSMLGLSLLYIILILLYFNNLSTDISTELDWYPSLCFKDILSQMNNKKTPNLKENSTKERNKTLKTL